MLAKTIPPVNSKVKGLLKGLRYISEIFENEKEQEMVIGNPTDVKHVAHIGWDGPQVTNPSWMTEFHSAPLSTTFGNEGKEGGSSKSSSQEIPLGRMPPPSPSRDEPASPKHRRTRRHSSSEAPGSESPARERGVRHSRKHQSAGSTAGSESPSRDVESSRRSRRPHKSDKPDSQIGSGCESPARDLPSIPKEKKKKERRSKGSTDGGSSRSSHRSKDRSLSDTGAEERIAAPVRVEDA